MKNIIFFSIIIIFFFSKSLAFTQENIVYLDVDYIFNNSNNGKILKSKLNQLNEQNNQILKKKETEIINFDKDINLKKNIINKAELEKKINELNNKIREFNDLKNKLNNDYEKIKNDELTSFFNNISPLIQSYMLENSIKIIFDKKNIFLADKKNDISEDILKLINKN